MKPLTGEQLLLKLRELRFKRADLILSLTGYLGKDSNVRYSNGEHKDFCKEFHWAYVEKNGSPAKIEGEDYYKKAPNMISPNNYILPPDLVNLKLFRRFEHALQTGHISYKKEKGPITIQKPVQSTKFALVAQSGKKNLSDNPNPQLEGEELLDLVRSLPDDMPSDQIAYKAGYKNFQEYRFNLSKALGRSNAHERRLIVSRPVIEENQREPSSQSEAKPIELDIDNDSSRLSRIRDSERRLESSTLNRSSSDGNKIRGQEIIDFAVAEHEAGVHETSICIKAGYKTDLIGQFRRAFAKAADVDLPPLSRMIAEYRKQFDSPEALISVRSFTLSSTKARLRDGGFRESVISLHGHQCQVCGIELQELIEAAHIVPVASDGVDHPANGIPLCPTHHSAFDRHLFAFDPADQSVVFKDGLNASKLGITKAKLVANVSTEALKMRYELFLESNCG